jgi:hypothetical protein
MHAVVVFESMFGNTESVARAVADGLGRHVPGEVVDASGGGRPVLDDLAVLVVGGPTHAFGLSRPSTRADAAQRPGYVASGSSGLREWLDALPAGRSGLPAAAFDTRIRGTRFLGPMAGAAGAAARRLRRRGFDVVVRPESFWVADTPGPLAPGEAERARAWGETLGSTVAAATATAQGRVS